MSARFLHPTAAIQAFREDKISFMPPQYYILSTLCDILEGNENTILQRGKIEMLSQGAFGRMVINPVMLSERDAQGRQILAYEGDEARGGPKGRIHRALIGVPGNSAAGVCVFWTIKDLPADHLHLSAVQGTRAHAQF